MSMRTYSFRAEEGDMMRWASLAALEGVPLSDWIRHALLRREAEDTAPEGVVRARRRGKAVRQLVKALEEMA